MTDFLIGGPGDQQVVYRVRMELVPVHPLTREPVDTDIDTEPVTWLEGDAVLEVIGDPVFDELDIAVRWRRGRNSKYGGGLFQSWKARPPWSRP